MSLDELRREVAQFADDRDWNQFHIPRSLVLALMAEVGELAEVMQWTPDPELDAQWVREKKTALVEEVADVFIYLVRIADILGIDLEEAARFKIRENARKYPVDKSHGNATKYTDL